MTLTVHDTPREVPSADSRPKTDSFDEPPYKIVKIDGKGEGLVATRDLAPGDFITSEKVQLKWHSSEQSFYRLEWMLSRLSEEDRNAFYNLHNCYTKEELGCPEELLPPDIIGKWDTNCFAIQDGYKILLLGPITKVNHSCRPNVSHEYRAETDTMTLVAQDYISIGQELSITYVDLFQDRFHRRWHTIMSWGFLCECQACNLTGEELQLSDERRTRIANISDVELPRQKTCPQQRIRLVSVQAGH